MMAYPICAYWNVGNSTTQVFSTLGAAYVPLTDATYQAWLAAGNVAMAIDSETSLWQALAAVYPGGLPAGNATAAQIRTQTEIGNMALSELKVLFWLVNQVRALQSQTPLTRAQFLTAITNLTNPQ